VRRLEEACRFGQKVLPRLEIGREGSKARNFTWSTLFGRDLSTVKGA
jgi:alkanesulfonate monooxygenase